MTPEERAAYDMFKLIERYEETGLGLPYPIILLNSAEQEIDDTTGQVVGISVPDLETLVASVAMVRVLLPVQLAAGELRFLRGVVGMTATAMAAELDLDKATYSRWENGKQVCGEWADKQVRQIVVITLGGQVPGLSVDPKTVIGLRIRHAVPDEWPHIEMRRVPVPRAGSSDLEQGWDVTDLPHAA